MKPVGRNSEAEIGSRNSTGSERLRSRPWQRKRLIPSTMNFASVLIIIILFSMGGLGCASEPGPGEVNLPIPKIEVSVQMQTFAQQWGQAFHRRNADTIHSLCLDEELYSTIGSQAENGRYVMGWSSPWPWYDDHITVMGAGNSFDIYYFFRTSDPHIYVAKQTVRCQEVDGALRAAAVEMKEFYSVASKAEYEEAYRYGMPDYQDYADSISASADENDNDTYQTLCDPLQSCLWQLNLVDMETALRLNKEENQAVIKSTWKDGSVAITMTRHESGIWLVEPDPAAKSAQLAGDQALAQELYQYKGTYIGDNSAVHAIANSLPFTGLSVDRLTLHTDSEPYGCTIDYKIGERAQWYRDPALQQETRHHLNQNAAVLLALIDNADYISFSLQDEYGEFFSCYYAREAIAERDGMGKFTPAFIGAATDSTESFQTYFQTVRNLRDVARDSNSYTSLIYSALSAEEEIVTNSGLAAEFIYTPDFTVAGYDLKALARDYNIDPATAEGQDIAVMMFQISNYTHNPQTSEPYLFIFCGGELSYHQVLDQTQAQRARAFIAAAHETTGL